MKTKSTVRETLGITQQDMADLLAVSRTLYSLFELGKRDLPMEAKLLFAEIVAHLNAPEKSEGGQKQVQHVQKATTQGLERLLDENERQQLSVAKKLSVANRKNKRTENYKQLVILLNELPADKKGIAKNAVRRLERKVTKASNGKQPTDLLQYEIKKKVLEYERALLLKMHKK